MIVAFCYYSCSNGSNSRTVNFLEESQSVCDTTIVIGFTAFACECPRWIDSSEFNRFYLRSGEINCEIDINQIDNYGKGYFIKNEQVIPDSLCVKGNQIKVRGSIKNFKDTIWFKDSPMTHELEICSYEMVKPYHIIKREFVQIDQWGDSLFEAIITLAE